MLRGLDASDERFLAALGRVQEKLERAQKQIGTGKRLTRASDDPSQVSVLLTTKAGLEQNLQIGLNLQRAKSEADVAEKALQDAVKILDRAGALAVQAASETVAPEQRKTIGISVKALLEQLVSLASAEAEGRHLFSGDTDTVAPYTVVQRQPGDPPGTPEEYVSAYAGAASTRMIQHPNGTEFAVSRTAQEILDAPGASVFAAVTDLEAALQNGPTAPPGDPLYQTQYRAQTDAISAALGELHTASDHLNGELAFYGMVQRKVEEAIDYSASLTVRQRAGLSEIQDADLTQAALELNQADAQREAMLTARARKPRTSLFDYLG